MNFIEQQKEIEKENRELVKKTLDYRNLLKKYSTFNVKSIMDVITNILSTIEGTEFKRYDDIGTQSLTVYFYQSKLDLSKEEITIYSRDRLLKEKKLMMLIGYNYHMGENHIFKEGLTFYSLYYDEICDYGKLNYLVYSYGNPFPYIREFINEVVEYRFENSLEEISDEELNMLKCKFLERKLEEKRSELDDNQRELDKKLNLKL